MKHIPAHVNMEGEGFPAANHEGAGFIFGALSCQPFLFMLSDDGQVGMAPRAMKQHLAKDRLGGLVTSAASRWAWTHFLLRSGLNAE